MNERMKKVRVVAQKINGGRWYVEKMPREKVDPWCRRVFGSDDAHLEIDGEMGFIYKGDC